MEVLIIDELFNRNYLLENQTLINPYYVTQVIIKQQLLHIKINNTKLGFILINNKLVRHKLEILYNLRTIYVKSNIEK